MILKFIFIVTVIISNLYGIENNVTYNECDLLASNPYDKLKPKGIKGIKLEDLNPTKAIKACKQAVEAEPNNLRYAYNLGRAYDSAKNYSEAYKWYLKAAMQSYVGAQFSIGNLYYKGKGVKKDYKKVYKWFLKAANQGDDITQYAIGFLYYNGEGVKKDYKKAYEWFLKAANQGYDIAQYVMGLLYYKGKGVKKKL